MLLGKGEIEGVTIRFFLKSSGRFTVVPSRLLQQDKRTCSSFKGPFSHQSDMLPQQSDVYFQRKCAHSFWGMEWMDLILLHGGTHKA